MDSISFEDKIKTYGQQHLIHYYTILDDDGKARLESQINNLDRHNIDLETRNSYGIRGVFTPVKVLELNEINNSYTEYEEIGINAISQGKLAVVLLAGGQGTRLGFLGPKGTYNIGITKDLFIFQLLIENVTKVGQKANHWISFYIMTSDKNHEDTIAFFEKYDFFEYPKEKIKFFKQDTMPSVDFYGKILMEDKDKIACSPNGNGGWFSSLVRSGFEMDLKKEGIEWINVVSVDNVLQQIGDPVFLGATIASKAVCGAKVIKKAYPEEKVGTICLEDGKPSIVEYYELGEEMLSRLDSNGEPLYNFGVTLNYLFRTDSLKDNTIFHMPLHVVKRKIPYMDQEFNYIEPKEANGYKFEYLVLDMIHLMDSCLPFEVEREKEFAPIKNFNGIDSTESARKLLRKNGVKL